MTMILVRNPSFRLPSNTSFHQTISATANGMTNMATASRQLFAFARDKGVPFHNWFARVPSGWDIPLNGKTITQHIRLLLAARC
jgi:amino acid transporter